MMIRENLKIELDKEEHEKGGEIVMLVSEESNMKIKRIRIRREEGGR